MKIYIAMHKIVDVDVNKKIYEPILVGAKGKESKNITRDDSGDNISEKNKNYCELTAIYWIWKNINENIVGLCHYRRFFYKNIFSMKKRNILDEDTINNDLKKYDIIVPKKEYMRKTNKESYNVAPNSEDMNILRNIIKEKFSDYYDSFIKFENQKYRYLYNMYITKKEISDEYCTWLFDVLKECENQMTIDDNDTYRRRMYGFLSERLLNVWIIKKQLKVKEYYVFNREKNFLDNWKNNTKNIIKKVCY